MLIAFRHRGKGHPYFNVSTEPDLQRHNILRQKSLFSAVVRGCRLLFEAEVFPSLFQIADLQQEHQREMEGLLENVRQLSRELHLQMLIIDQFVPPEYQVSVVQVRSQFS